ncbi:LuxR C-terminal-related transcriptional regulator [Actinomadura xylanilytica]|uniref:LuxR C-terminal-related transcriptional regulator n=1 Tax=Actinomadura xylanilytica TaxID=887459 RepID=UPI00255AA052|nr:LuxR C-terminal-related transcriptional regulator [Actinomadura xylanilytica]MDL4774614.1 LuxR C-terminal-related transcriptional regulator [Actinomadura xylanilytica]
MSDRAARPRPAALPAEVSRFVGRRRELMVIEEALGRSRLVTLVGVGGVGKTRLALRAATRMRDTFADGALFVELSALRKPELLARTVAAALRLPDQTAGDPLDLLAGRLTDRHLLLVLDTCEHLVDACAPLVGELLHAAPRLCVLATSREPLDVTGEHTLLVPPLDTVQRTTAGRPGAGRAGEERGGTDADCESVRLFADRAEAMVPGFALTSDNREAVARLCSRLEGLPLAIELAAVRLRVMSVEQIDARLGDRFRLLGTSRAGRDRHQTLRAAVGWSHELCTPAERALWARLSVFPGDFDLKAAEHVCAGGDLPAADLFDVLGRLVEKSIVLCEDGGRRYRMLDTIRDYGAEHLDGLGERDALRLRHRDHYFALARRAMTAAAGARQIPELRRLRAENANLRVALDHALSTPGSEPDALRLLAGLQTYWLALGLFGEARHWYDRALAACPPPMAERGWPCHADALFAVLQGDLATARPLLDEAQHLAAGDPELEAHVLETRARLALYADDLREAIALHERARAIFNGIGYRDPYAMGNHMLLASAHLFAGDIDRALASAEEGLALSRERGDQWSLSFTLYVRGGAHWMRGDIERAHRDALDALSVKEAFGDLFGITISVDLLSACAMSRGDFDRAGLLVGAAGALWETLGAPIQLGPRYLAIREGVEKGCRQGLAPERYEEVRARGRDLPVERVIALARGTGPVAGPDGADGADRDARGDGAQSTLTRREAEVAGLVAEGLPNREIAERLGIAKRTADSHVEHILAKLGFASRIQIAVWAERRGKD